MILSHSHRFIFIHIYKNGGSSVKHVLANYDYPSLSSSGWVDKLRFMTHLYPKVFSREFGGHSTALELQRALPGKVFDKYFKFAFVRNPISWQQSLFQFALNIESHHEHKVVKEMDGLEDYIEWQVNSKLILQKSFVTDRDGNLLVDYIGRIEEFQKDFDKISSLVGLPQMPLPIKNTSGSSRIPVTPTARERILEVFSEDFEFFGYPID